MFEPLQGFDMSFNDSTVCFGWLSVYGAKVDTTISGFILHFTKTTG